MLEAIAHIQKITFSKERWTKYAYDARRWARRNPSAMAGRGPGNTVSAAGNPTGNQNGGGAGYSDVVTTYTYYYVNNTVDELIKGLAMATTGDVVYVNDAAALDLSGYEWIVIPGGVTLA